MKMSFSQQRVLWILILSSTSLMSTGCEDLDTGDSDLAVTVEEIEGEVRGGRRPRPPRREQPSAVISQPAPEEEPQAPEPPSLLPIQEDPAPISEDPNSNEDDSDENDQEEPVQNPEADYLDASIQRVLDLPEVAFDYAEHNVPTAFAREALQSDNTPDDNQTDDDLATLGRVLFYDPALSRNEEVSCASCHQQALGFSDQLVLSEGFDGELTGRHSMSLINIRYYSNGAMFWDERATTLEEQVLGPIQDEVEMGMTLGDLVDRLSATEHYPVLFEIAFGDSDVTSERISLALANFVRSISSFNSPYDQGLAAANGDPMRPFPNFSAEENRGKTLFFAPPQAGGAGCAGCHLAPPQGGRPAPGTPRPTSIFFVNGGSNTGLTNGRGPNEDLGIGAVTGRIQDQGKFKSPSLRQVGLTAPYMHDGSIATLRGVIDHYNDGVQAHPNLDPRLRGPNGAPQRLNLTEEEKQDLEAFLHTLTDASVSQDVRFSDPFR